MSEVKVQVICVTYNQKDYIREALDSFLMQKTNFKFEVLVGDDCSTDGTSEIVAEYAEKYPDIIKHIRREPNMGCLANFMDLCERADAKYVAFCDGDDYWTNENKLQKQYDFMETHKDVNICAHKTLILADESWNLYSYYAKQKEPFIVPDINKTPVNSFIKIDSIMKQWPHTSSLLVRNVVKKYPNWAKSGGSGGDMSVIFLNLGDKSCFILNDCMGIYRRSELGVNYTNKDMTEHFLKTRVHEYFRVLSGTISYFKANYNSFKIASIEERLWSEIINYTNTIVKSEKWEKLIELKDAYPDEYNNVVLLLSEYKYRLQQINKLGIKQANLLRRSSTLKIIKPILKIIYRTKKVSKNITNAIKRFHSFSSYWLFALVPKKKNLWVFSGFLKKNYMDNTKYLYEYVVENHPEIKAVWLTKSKEVRKFLKENKMPVHRINSLAGIWTMARANIAFSDHFKMSDYDNRCGFNARTKFVNLWHGTGPKSMIPKGDKLPNTDVPGVRLSSDIIINNKDNIFVKFIKLLKYPFIAPFRELFEKYYTMLTTGTPFENIVVNPWRIPEKAKLFAGYPRNTVFYTSTSNFNSCNILYAPTYRWNARDEKAMINMFLQNIDNINQFLENINGAFTLRLHPHTWRNYENEILNKISDYPRFTIDKEKDIYKSLASYSLMITDYSSIGYDFLITQKPIIYLAFDYETYEKTDCPFNMPYKENCAGDVVYTWNEAIESMKKSFNNTDYNKKLREEILEKFFPSKYNDENNSRRIVEELEKRLKIGVN